MIRLIPNRRSEPVDADELNGINELIQARIDGRISRRALMRRGAQLGMSAPLIGVMLHATSDYAFGAPSNGRVASLAALRQDGAVIPVTGPTAPAGTKVVGGTVTTGTNEEPDTIHPWLSQLVTGSDVYIGIVEPMMKYDSNQQLIPALAESYEISEDGLVYTFKLRQGVTFHNGDAFTANDVIESWKMLMNPDFAAFNTQGWDKITDITAADEYTAVVTTSEVFAPFISYLSDNGSNICPASEIAKGVDSFKQEFGRAPVGTGPFSFVEWRAKEQIVLQANPNYWGGAPNL
ncbi:MAG: ABC transporter substrate-binding protein, partial [Thermomicrobiales bacterium]|nr:ABC transporter substrate-binding protein [Thermomicrobiales bacterium]